MEKNHTIDWTIINSINLAKLYPLNETKIFIYSSLKLNNHLKQFLNEFKIPYYVINKRLAKSNYAYFGKSVNFQNLYIIAGIIKSYGYDKFYYNPKLDEKITLGSSKRNTINQRKSNIKIDTILSLPFNTDINYIIKIIDDLFKESAEKVDIIDFGVKSGLINKEDLQKPDNQLDYEDDFEDDDYDQDSRDYESSYDPHENFHWGGLSGEEAHTGYWNCD